MPEGAQKPIYKVSSRVLPMEAMFMATIFMAAALTESAFVAETPAAAASVAEVSAMISLLI